MEVVFVVLAALGAAVCVATLAARLPVTEPVFETSLRAARAKTDRWPAQLVRVEQLVGSATAGGVDAHTRLRPILLEIAETRLARRGLRLETEEARRLLGPVAWELLRPDRPAPGPAAPGIGRRDLESILDALEAL